MKNTIIRLSKNFCLWLMASVLVFVISLAVCYLIDRLGLMHKSFVGWAAFSTAVFAIVFFFPFLTYDADPNGPDTYYFLP